MLERLRAVRFLSGVSWIMSTRWRTNPLSVARVAIREDLVYMLTGQSRAIHSALVGRVACAGISISWDYDLFNHVVIYLVIKFHRGHNHCGG